MINRRLINCDFLNESSFTSCLSNKAKLLYLCFLTNADDLGFVGNAKDIAETLDRCEEVFENTLFTYKFVDAISELVDRRFVYKFEDKVGNKIYLIKHWFLHNKQQNFLTTNYLSFYKMVEIIDGEYQLKNHEREKPYKEKEIKENKSKTKVINNLNVLDNEDISNTKIYDKQWDDMLDDMDDLTRGDVIRNG